MVKPSLFGDRKRKTEQKALLDTIREDLGGQVESRGKYYFGVSVLAARAQSLQNLFLAAMHPEEGAIEMFGASGSTNGWEEGLR